MLSLIQSLPDRTGCAVLLSSHLLQDVERVCQRALLLHQGEVVYAGGIEELRREGQKDLYEVRVKQGEEKLRAALQARGCRVEVVDGILTVRLPDGTAKPTELIFATARAEGLQVRHLSPRRLTLERAFVRAVKDAAGGTA
jgi:ABC-2 type transport system ATP-binding protein